MYDDSDNVPRLVEKLADVGKDVVLVMHSYGGLPGLQACEGLSKTERQGSEKKGGTVRLLYMAAGVAPVGKSMAEIARMDTPLPSIETAGGHVSLWTSICVWTAGVLLLAWASLLISIAPSSIVATQVLWAYHRNPDVFTKWLLAEVPRKRP